MKKMLFVLLVVILTACTQAPTATATMVPTVTPVPPTATAVPTLTATPTLTPTPPPAVTVQLFSNNYPTRSIVVGQPLFISSGVGFATEDRINTLVKNSEIHVWIDENDPIIITDLGIWGPVEPKDLGSYGRVYFRYWTWQAPDLSPGKHLIKAQIFLTKMMSNPELGTMGPGPIDWAIGGINIDVQ